MMIFVVCISSVTVWPCVADGWCSIWYWEYGHRVGEMFDVSKESVTVLGDDTPPLMGADTALCLNLLSASHHKDSEESRKTRQKIGLGE